MKQLIFTILLALLVINAKSQDSCYTKWKFSIMSEAISFPTYKLVKQPVHPGFSLGYNLKTKSVRQHSQAFDVNFGYYYHPLMGNSFLFWPEYSYKQKFLKQFSLEGMSGLGYRHNISDRQVYRSEGDGAFKKATDWGSPQAFVSFGIGLGYEITTLIKIYTDYRFMAAYPFGNPLPMSLHTMFNMGVQYQFRKNNVSK
jgi:hypothetical protein